MKKVLDKLFGRTDPSADLPLANHIETNPPHSIHDVVARMYDSDGLTWFDKVYDMVTQALVREIDAGALETTGHDGAGVNPREGRGFLTRHSSANRILRMRNFAVRGNG